MKRKIVITIDTEALPGRAPNDHFQKLIWGRFDGVEMGVGKMMQIANRYSVPLTFFVDLLETPLYPNDFKGLADEIIKNGHDFQLHAHPHIMPVNFSSKENLSRSSVHMLTEFNSEKMFEYLIGESLKLTGLQPVSFRGGAFAYSNNTLKAMAKFSIDMSFNYSINSRYQSGNLKNLPVFNWTNGVFEVPMSFLVRNGRNLPFEFGENSALKFNDLNAIKIYANEYFSTLGEDAVLVLLMHSWSLLSFDKQSGFYFYKNDHMAGLFNELIQELKIDYEIVSSVQLRDYLKSKNNTPQLFRNIDIAKYNHTCKGY